MVYSTLISTGAATLILPSYLSGYVIYEASSGTVFFIGTFRG